ncbi:MAG: PAS domain-containing protein [Bernardetiaceae bacterium]|nr:PAS domain-containing protein [Bernardetiaceae bacterium]
MRKFNLSIGRRVLLANIPLILIAAGLAISSLVILVRSQRMIDNSFEVITPSVEEISNFTLLITQSRMYITNWVHLPENDDDKKALRKLHNRAFPQVKSRISNLKRNWKNLENVALIDSIIIDYDEVLQAQKEIMQRLDDPTDYNNGEKRNKSIEKINLFIVPRTEMLISKLERLSEEKLKEEKQAAEQLTVYFVRLQWMLSIFALMLFISGLAATWLTYKIVSDPIKKVNRVISELSIGIIPKEFNTNFGKHEIGAMAQALNQLILGLRNTSEFAKKIGAGSYTVNFKPLSDKDVLGNALLGMRDNLEKVSEEDQKRNWSSEGLAIFADLLRENHDTIDRFSEAIIVELVKYTGGNQGGVFLLNAETQSMDIDKSNVQLELTGCYAWGKKKYIEKQIQAGEGLAGQAWQEERTIYVTEVPKDYIHIKSGLGEANPRAIIIVPLKVNEQVFGVIEMAFMGEIPKYKIEFIERIAESFAATLASVRNRERMRRLLEDAQQMAEQMKEQEEEMRQNMEELQSTQEAIERKNRDFEAQLNAINKSAGMIIIDPRGRIISINDKYLELTKYQRNELVQAKATKILKDGIENSSQYVNLWENLRRGIPVESEGERKDKEGNTFWIRGAYYPVMDNKNKLEKVIHIGTDITEEKNKTQALEQSLQEQKEIFEQMESQEIIMRDAFDEMQKVSEEAEAKQAALQKELDKAIKKIAELEKNQD